MYLHCCGFWQLHRECCRHRASDSIGRPMLWSRATYTARPAVKLSCAGVISMQREWSVVSMIRSVSLPERTAIGAAFAAAKSAEPCWQQQSRVHRALTTAPSTCRCAHFAPAPHEPFSTNGKQTRPVTLCGATGSPVAPAASSALSIDLSAAVGSMSVRRTTRSRPRRVCAHTTADANDGFAAAHVSACCVPAYRSAHRRSASAWAFRAALKATAW
mmetsp:Transcript_5083/g.16108  ORF Transcript_5083/g.16108 Transcript_5083/m.16108 type:complete len:216 (+) Transcript_5083:675-1322(+)